MPPQYPTYQQSIEALKREQARRTDPREGLFGRSFRPQEDINLPPEPPREAEFSLPPTPDIYPAGPRAPRPPSLEEMREAPYGQVATTPSYPGGSDLGTAIYEGPRLNTEESLAGLRSAQPQFPRSFEPSTEELYRHVGLPSETVAPGSQAQMGAMLQGRIGDEAYGDLQQRKQLEMIQASLASLHPGVQRAAELEAQRRALPAEVAGRAQLQGSLAAAESRRDVAGMNLQRGDLAAQLQQAGQLAQAIARIQAKTNQSDEDRALVQQLYGLYTALITDAYGGEEDYEEEVP